jgi:tetratricopeptide (TPR) repeat protein
METQDQSQSQFESKLDEARTLLAGDCDSQAASVANDLVIRALALRPESCSAWTLKCQVHSTLGDDTAALAAIEMAVRFNPTSAETLYWRAAVLSDLGRHSDALKTIHRCFRYVQADDAWLLEDLYCEKAMLLNAIGRDDEAVATYEAGLRRCPRSSLLKAGLAPLRRATARKSFTVLEGGATRRPA